MKSKQTKAHEITQKTKETVYIRQRGRSIFPPHKEITVDMCCCHYIPRSRGGLGEEWNIFGCYQTPWLDEHKMYDRQIRSNLSHEEMEEIIIRHFKENYDGWDEEKCKYRKYVTDYGIRRKK